MKRVAVASVLLTLAGCTVSQSRYTESQPNELAGRWVLLRQDGTWGDTSTWRRDGTMLGSTNHPVPPDARWSARVSDDGARAICVRGGGEANCQPYVLTGDTLVWGTGAEADRFRRVASAGEP